MPSELNTAKIFFLISGILNALAVAGWGGTTILGGISTCGIGCVLGFLPVINLVACILDFIAYSKLNNLNQPGTAGSVKNAAIMDIVTILTGNVVSLIFGILNLQYINQPHVDNYLRERNIY